MGSDTHGLFVGCNGDVKNVKILKQKMLTLYFDILYISS